jgi:hypothetical protein
VTNVRAIHDLILITRFNLRTDSPSWNDRYTKNWMQNRLELFNSFCLPSVKRQLIPPKKWCIFFDTERSRAFEEEIKGIKSAAPFIETVFINHISHIRQSLINLVECAGSPIITTRLDNDDVLHPLFISDIQRAFISVSAEGQFMSYVIDFPTTLFWNIKNNTMKLVQYTEPTAFASLVEKPMGEEDFETVGVVPHLELKVKFGVVRYIKEVRTMAVVHGENILNGIEPKGIRSRLHRLLRSGSDNLAPSQVSQVLRDFKIEG